MRNFFPFGLGLVLVFLGAIALSHVPKGVTASDDVSIEKVAQESRYQVSGDRQGKVTVRNPISGEIIRTFEMDSGVVVRETFLLDNGRTVAASQKDHTVFWDLATGREIRRLNRRIYGFSSDGTKFFSYTNSEGLFLYNYPDLKPICSLLQEPMSWPKAYLFSPNGRFLVILFTNVRPESDEYYPTAESINLGIYISKLFNLQSCQEIKEFSEIDSVNFGDFSADSRFLYLDDEFLFLNHRFSPGPWRFNLTNYQVERVVN